MNLDRAALDELKQLTAEVIDDVTLWFLTADRKYQPDLALARDLLTQAYGNAPDLVVRRIALPEEAGGGAALVVFLDGVVDKEIVDRDIVAPLLRTAWPPGRWGDRVFWAGAVQSREQWRDLVVDLANGATLVMSDQDPRVWSLDTSKYPARQVSQPQTELSVRGANEAFSEVGATQLAQLRHRLRDPALRVVSLKIGHRQHAPVLVAYLAGVANSDLVQEVLRRLGAVDIDGQISSAQISGLIRDHPWSIFPTVRTTERVDLAADALLKGKVAVLVDGDPFVLIVPAVLADFYLTAMDYTAPWYDTSFVRLIRVVGWAIGVYLPGLYIALTEVNVNLLPPPLLILTAGNHAGLPFPPVVEALLMVFVIEVLREAALRLPQMLSVTIGTVGAIVVGTAVVRAGLVSPQMIIVITLTALSFYSVPVYELTGTWRLVNFLMLMAGAIVGVYGLVWISLWLIATLIGLTSFGVPYFTPMAPFQARDWRDLFVRAAWPRLGQRPMSTRPQDRTRWARSGGS